jgi:hypothetical protein
VPKASSHLRCLGAALPGEPQGRRRSVFCKQGDLQSPAVLAVPQRTRIAANGSGFPKGWAGAIHNRGKPQPLSKGR